MEQSSIFAAIKRNVVAIVPEINPNAISMDSSLSDLGCNSIDRAEVVTMTMEELCIAVPVHHFHQGDSIRQLVALFQSHA